MTKQSNKIQEFLDKKVTEHFSGQSKLARAALLLTSEENKKELYKIEKALPNYLRNEVAISGAIGLTVGTIFAVFSSFTESGVTPEHAALFFGIIPAGLVGLKIADKFAKPGEMKKARTAIYNGMRENMEKLSAENWDLKSLSAYHNTKGYAPSDKEALDGWVSNMAKTATPATPTP